MRALPKTFTVTITEEDRQKAGRFCNEGACLIATAVRRTLGTRRRMDENVNCIFVGSGKATVTYRHQYHGWRELRVRENASFKPFYRPSIVGHQITFTRA